MQRYGTWLAATIILLTGIFVLKALPDPRDYRTGADEGTYYRQAETLVREGTGGFERIARDFALSPSLQEYPNPLRVGTISVAAMALNVDDSYRSLSFVSLFSFLILLIGAWRFVDHFWGREHALATLLLLAASPLALAMSRRALMDSLAYTTAAFSVFSFFYLVERGTRRSLAIFVVTFAFAILVKETAVLLLPFYLVALVYLKIAKQLKLDWPSVLIALVLPPIIVGIAYVSAYGVDGLTGILNGLHGAFSGDYTKRFQQGPWYRYFVDFLMLSPFTLLLAIAYAGYLFGTGYRRWNFLLFAFAVFLPCAFAFLPKSARYVLLLDLPIRLFAASMLLALPQYFAQATLDSRIGKSLSTQPSMTKFLSWLPALILGLLVVTDVAAFQRYFIVESIYDPVSYNFLRVNRIVPDAAEIPLPGIGIGLSTARAQVLQRPDAEGFLQLGYEYCAAGMHLECSWASRESLRLSGDNATAYNNLCTAYNGMHDWQNAIAACGEALRLKPDFQLARNNLVWAQAHAAEH